MTIDANSRIPAILDCDNTMGVPGCDIDDGLALLYILGSPEIELIGITCTFGNNNQETVFTNTKRLVESWGLDIPVYRGAESKSDRDSEAARFLAEQAQNHSGELVVFATGSMSNLLEAERYNPKFFSQVRTISIMGGVTGDFAVNGVPMKELNLSCDPEASLAVLSRGNNVMIATAENSLHSFFDRDEMYSRLEKLSPKLLEILKPDIEYWFDIYSKKWKLNGFVNWDVMAVVQFLHPEYFKDMSRTVINPDIKSLETGLLFGDGADIEVILPVIADENAYRKHVCETYANSGIVDTNGN